MSETNEETIAAYDTHVKDYVANTPADISETAKEWLAVSLKGLKTSARILEIGSAFGHDAHISKNKVIKLIEQTHPKVSWIIFRLKGIMQKN